MERIIIDEWTYRELMRSHFWRAAIGYALQKKAQEGHKIFYRDELGMLTELDYALIQ
jgi:hypothetical protein